MGRRFPAFGPGKGFVRFDPQEDDEAVVELGIKEIVWSSFHDDLDATSVRLDGPVPDVDPIPLAAELPNPTEAESERIYIMGHPKGCDELAYSMSDYELIGYERHLLYYHTLTRKGSSGSPVLNRHWELIGLHHFGNRSVRVTGFDAKPIRAN